MQKEEEEEEVKNGIVPINMRLSCFSFETIIKINWYTFVSIIWIGFVHKKKYKCSYDADTFRSIKYEIWNKSIIWWIDFLPFV